MKGDRMLCMNPACHKLFKEAEDFYDSRDEKIKRMCPYCGGTNTVNVEYYIDKFIKATSKGNPKLVALDEDVVSVLKLMKSNGIKLVKQTL